VAVTGHEKPSRCELLPWRHTATCDGSGSRHVKTPRQRRWPGHLRLVIVRTNEPGNLARRRTLFVIQRVIGPSWCFGRVRHNCPRASATVRHSSRGFEELDRRKGLLSGRDRRFLVDSLPARRAADDEEPQTLGFDDEHGRRWISSRRLCAACASGGRSPARSSRATAAQCVA
jgi:hypothetical protein